jgi:hypothetical protein
MVLAALIGFFLVLKGTVDFVFGLMLGTRSAGG